MPTAVLKTLVLTLRGSASVFIIKYQVLTLHVHYQWQAAFQICVDAVVVPEQLDFVPFCVACLQQTCSSLSA